MATTAAQRPVLVHRRGVVPLRAVQVLSSRGPWVPVVSREVHALGLSRLVLFRHRRGGASCSCAAGPATQAVSGRPASGAHPCRRGGHATHPSTFACPPPGGPRPSGPGGEFWLGLF